MIATKTQIAAIRATAAQVGGTISDDYSGRGMYGKTCYGIDCDDSTECILAAGANGLTRPTVDNMGRGYIVYWPNIQPAKDNSNG